MLSQLKNSDLDHLLNLLNWLVFAKYHLWGIFPTQFLPKNINFVAELENGGKYEFLKFTTLLTCQTAR